MEQSLADRGEGAKQIDTKVGGVRLQTADNNPPKCAHTV